MLELVIVWAISFAVVWYVGTLRNKDKINWILAEIICGLGVLILSPLIFIGGFGKSLWTFIKGGYQAVKNDKD